MGAYRQVCDQRGWAVTVALAVSPVNGMMFHSAYIGEMNAPRLKPLRSPDEAKSIPRREGYLHLRRSTVYEAQNTGSNG